MKTILEELSSLGIILKLKGENIAIVGKKENLTDHLLSEIKRYKKEIIAYLNAQLLLDQIPAIEEQEYYMVSNAQQRLFLEEEKTGNTGLYNIPEIHEIEYDVSQSDVENIFRTLMQKHEVLTTCFVYVDDVLMQKKRSVDEVSIPLTFLDFSDEKNKEQRVKIEYETFASKPFELINNLLWSACLIKTGEKKSVLMINFHHTIYDGASKSVLLADFLDLLTTQRKEENYSIAPDKIDYKDYTAWHRKIIADHHQGSVVEYWKNKVTDFPTFDFPHKQVPKKNISNKSTCLSIDMGASLSNKIKTLAKQNRTSLYTVLLAGVKAVLYKYTGKNDLNVLIPVDGRKQIELQKIVGLFTNTLPLRTTFSEDSNFTDLVGKVKTELQGAIQHQMYPFDFLINDIRKLNSLLNLVDLINVMVTYTVIDEPQKVREEIEESNAQAKFDIEFFFEQNASTISLNLNYKKDLFEADFMKNLALHIRNGFEQFVNSPSTSIKTVDLLSREEKETLASFNHKDLSAKKFSTALQLFQEQLEANPNKVASVFRNKEMTYGELNQKSDFLAQYLIDNGIKKGDLVCILLDGSPNLLVSILGIIKSGAAYVPIDVKNPKDRIDYILQDTKSRFLISEETAYSDLSIPEETEVLEIDQLLIDASGNKTVNLSIEIELDDLVYIIYTSGSTGKPKGVKIKHEGLGYLVHNMVNALELDEQTRMLQFSSYSFDASCFEIFSTLCSGGTLILSTHKEKIDVLKMIDIIQSNNVNTLLIPPSYIKLLVGKMPTVTKIISGGEPIDISLVERINEGNVKLYNAYGPTENTVVATLSDQPLTPDGYVTIGKPLNDVTSYVLDASNQLLPIGVVGELCLAGKQVASGYLNRPEETAKSFVPNPFSDDDQLLYKTGDLVKWLPDGNLVFMGRKDHQVKIRGHRIELNEIEIVLQRYRSISQSVVLVQEDESGEKRLVAYVTSLDKSIDKKKIVAYMKSKLPVYMVPFIYVPIQEFPLTSNGKIDKKALMKMEIEGVEEEELKAPVTNTEKKLTPIFQEVLDVQKIGINSDFYELGGHSLKFFELQAKIVKEFGVQLPIQEVYVNTTIESLADCIDVFLKENKKELQRTIPIVAKQEYYEADLRQKKIYTRLTFSKKKLPYNVFFMDKIADVDPLLVEQSFQVLIEKHESLRTGFLFKNNNLYQRVFSKDEYNNIPFSYFDYANEEKQDELVDRLVDEYNNLLFDLDGPFLWKAALIHRGNGQSLLVVSLDHIISDGISLQVLARELLSIYNTLMNNGTPKLETDQIQLKDFTSWKNKQLQEDGPKYLAYWRNKVEQFDKDWSLAKTPDIYQGATYKEVIDKEINQFYRSITADERAFVYGKIFSAKPLKGDSYRTLLPIEYWNKIQRLAAEMKTGPFNILAACLLIMIARETNKEHVYIGGPFSFRDRPELQNIIGYMITEMLIDCKIRPDMTFKEMIKEVEGSIKNNMENIYPFEQLFDQLNIPFQTLGKVSLHLRSIDVTKESNVPTEKLYKFGENDAHAHYELNYDLDLYKEGLLFTCEYWRESFDKPMIKKYTENYLNVIREMLNKSDSLVSKKTRILSEVSA